MSAKIVSDMAERLVGMIQRELPAGVTANISFNVGRHAFGTIQEATRHLENLKTAQTINEILPEDARELYCNSDRFTQHPPGAVEQFKIALGHAIGKIHGSALEALFATNPADALGPLIRAEEHREGHLMVLRPLLERLLRISPDGREFSYRYYAQSQGVEANENRAQA